MTNRKPVKTGYELLAAEWKAALKISIPRPTERERERERKRERWRLSRSGGKVFTSEPFHYLSPRHRAGAPSRSIEQEYEHTKTLLRAYFNERVQGAGSTECGQLRRWWWFSSVVQRDHRKRWKHEGAHLESSPRERESKASHFCKLHPVLPVLLFCLFAGCRPPIPSVTSPSDPRQLAQACNAWFVTAAFSPRPPFSARSACSLLLLLFLFFFSSGAFRSKHEPIFSDA